MENKVETEDVALPKTRHTKMDKFLDELKGTSKELKSPFASFLLDEIGTSFKVEVLINQNVANKKKSKCEEAQLKFSKNTKF